MKNKRLLVHLVVFVFFGILVLSYTLAQQETPEGGPNLGVGLNLGVQTFLEGDQNVAYQKIGLTPDFSIGKFGVSLDLTFHVTPSEGSSPFKFREADWIPDGDTSFLELYLPKINYLRYGVKGEPLYVKFGSISDGTLGTGFIMGNYSNRLFLPEEKIFGLTFDLDGSFFGFPYVGIETNVANLSHIDVIGSRIYLRPLAWIDNQLLKNLEIGGTAAFDLDPAYRSEYFTVLKNDGGESIYDKDTLGDVVKTVYVFGADLIFPILTNPVFSLSLFGDFVFQPGVGDSGKDAMGVMGGFGGRIINFIPYAFQVRGLGENFIPTYFDATYDIYRAEKYQVISGETSTPDYLGWLGTLGFSLFEDQISFKATVDGPLNNADQYPNLRGVFTIKEGILPGVFLDAYYDKKNITSLSDLIDPEGAVIGLNINYKTGPAVITLSYDVRYNPTKEDFDTSAKLTTSIALY